MTTDANPPYPHPYPAAPQPYPGDPIEVPRDLVPGSLAYAEHAPGPAIPEGRRSAPRCPEPPSEVLMSLTGFDEIAIAVNYGQKIGDMREADAITTGRALAFVHMRRQGQRDREAHEASMGLTMREVVEYFAPEPVADAPASAEGNGER